MKKTEKSNTNEIIEIPAEEAPYALPDGWKWVRLGDLYEVNPKNIVENDVESAFIPMEKIKPGMISEFSYEVQSWFKAKKGHTQFADGDVAFAKITPCFENRKSMMLNNLPNGIGAGTTELIVLRQPKVLQKYTFWLVNSENFINGGKNTYSGTVGQQRISMDYVRSYPIPLPPLETQKRIVDRIESLFAKLDEAKEKAQTALDTFELRKSAILHKAFTGELTAGWRSSCRASDTSSASAHIESAPADISSSAPAEHIDNTSSDPVEHLNSVASVPIEDSNNIVSVPIKDSNNIVSVPIEDSNNLISVPSSLSPKQAESDSIEQDLPNSSLPNGWLIKSFSDVANIKLNLVEPSDYPNFPHIAPDSIEKKTGVLLEYRTVREDKVTSAKHRFYPGQILYSKIRPYLSKVVIIDFDGLCSADMYPIEPLENTRFIWYYMLSDEFLNQASNAGSRTVLPKINQKELSKIKVIVPPLPEQQEIVRILDDLLAKENAAKEAAEAVVEKIDLMKKSILARAFRGEL